MVCSRLGVMDVGGSHVAAAVVAPGDPAAAAAHHSIVARSGNALDSAADRRTLLDALLAPATRLQESGLPWTIALPGPFDYERGTGDFAGVGKFDSIAGVDLRAVVAAILRIPESDVRFVNDAEAFAIGEWSADDERADRFVGITLGTGVGSAFLDHGRAVRRGATVPPDGWMHLTEIDGAPLEHSVSTAALSGAYRTATGVELEVRDIAQRALAGEQAAVRVFHRTMQTLGRALAPWLARFDADELVIGGAISRSWPLIEPSVRTGLEQVSPGLGDLRVRRTALEDDAALIGAAEWTLSALSD